MKIQTTLLDQFRNTVRGMAVVTVLALGEQLTVREPRVAEDGNAVLQERLALAMATRGLHFVRTCIME